MMVSKQHCPACGFLMMMEIENGNVIYTCVNSHGSIGKDLGEYHMSENLAEAYKALGNNVDLLMQYLQRP